MPLFEYECQDCGCRMEFIQKMGARPLKKVECDECDGVRPVIKLLSAPAFQFKGDGWYVTDYADKKAKGKTSGESDSSKDSSDSSSKESSSSKDSKTKDKGKEKKDSSSSKGTKGSSKKSKK